MKDVFNPNRDPNSLAPEFNQVASNEEVIADHNRKLDEIYKVPTQKTIDALNEKITTSVTMDQFIRMLRELEPETLDPREGWIN